MSKGRKAIPVEASKLQEVITRLENLQNFSSRNALWQAVAASGYARSIGLSAQVAMLKAKTFGLTITTPVGQRGRAKGCSPIPGGGRRKGRKVSLDVVSAMKKEYDESLHKSVEKACAGSLKEAIRVKCIDCCGGSKKEVSLCTLITCGLWPARPYKNKLSLTEEGRKKIYTMDENEENESEALGIVGPDSSRAMVAV